ncbi:hypothetical protein B0H14DRAFT_3894054 [Mycena olivaceomarginata]|nr:hypothetical protein B0H14DRAFT_3894054 [Mycena olivaceomarginata]
MPTIISGSIALKILLTMRFPGHAKHALFYAQKIHRPSDKNVLISGPIVCGSLSVRRNCCDVEMLRLGKWVAFLNPYLRFLFTLALCGDGSDCHGSVCAIISAKFPYLFCADANTHLVAGATWDQAAPPDHEYCVCGAFEFAVCQRDIGAFVLFLFPYSPCGRVHLPHQYSRQLPRWHGSSSAVWEHSGVARLLSAATRSSSPVSTSAPSVRPPPPRRPQPHYIRIPVLQPYPRLQPYSRLLLRPHHLASVSPRLHPVPAHLMNIYVTPFPAWHVPPTPSPCSRASGLNPMPIRLFPLPAALPVLGSTTALPWSIGSTPARLDLGISRFLPLLVMEAPTGKVLEWLVRLFRINEFNLEPIPALFSPYCESPHFAKMLWILHIKPNSVWSFLLPFKAAAPNVLPVSLVTEMLKNSYATRFIFLTPHVVPAFNAATVRGDFTRTKTLDEGTLAHLVPALIERSDIIKDVILRSYILLSALARVCQLSPVALRPIINAMASSARRGATTQFLNAVVSVCAAQDLDTLTDGTGRSVLRLAYQELRTAAKWGGIENFIPPLFAALLRRWAFSSPFLIFLRQCGCRVDERRRMRTDERARTTAVKEMLASVQDDAVEHQPIRDASAIVFNALRLSGARARVVDASAQHLEEINLQRLAKVDMEKLTLTEMIVYKITSKATTNWLQVHIVVYAARIPRPVGLALDWFEVESAALSEASLYVKLIRAVYELTNSTSTNPLLTVGLLADVSSYPKDDALAFLAGIWTTSRDSTPDLCVIALQHAAAFLEAHNKEADGVVLLIYLPSADPETRTAALDCIAVQRSSAFSAVYAFDAIHGESEGSHLNNYLDAVVDHRKHIALDALYIKVFHVQNLGWDNGDKKKDSKNKRNVFCYILYHAHVLCLLPPRIALLQCVEDISDKSKIEVLLPVLLALNQDNRSVQPESPAEQFASLLVASFDLSASSALNDTKGPLWDVVVAIVQHYLQPGRFSCGT